MAYTVGHASIRYRNCDVILISKWHRRGCHSAKLLNTAVGYSLVAMVTVLFCNLT